MTQSQMVLPTLLLSSLLLNTCYSWLSSLPPTFRTLSFLASDTVIDAEFESTPDIKPPAPKVPKDKLSNTLLDWSIASYNETDFFHDKERSIPCRIACTIEHDDGQTYVLGVPSDPVVMVAIQTREETKYVDCDDPKQLELLELMAAQVHKQLGVDLVHTPRVLTIRDPEKKLDALTKNCKSAMVPPAATAVELLQDDEELQDEDDVLAFFREELGEDEFMKTMSDPLDKSLAGLFDFGDNDVEEEDPFSVFDLEQLESDWEQMQETLSTQKDSVVAVRLIAYVMEEKSYSVVRLMSPAMLMIARVKDGRFELLGAEERKHVGPMLAKKMQYEMQEAFKKVDQ